MKKSGWDNLILCLFYLIIYIMNENSKDEVHDFPQATPESNLKVSETSIEVELIKDHISNPKKKQAQIRSVRSTTYPEARVGNSLSGSIYSKDDFGFGDGDTYDENRVTWMDVPVEATIQSVQEDLSVFPEARIYRILSLSPVITEEQKRAMETGLSKYTNQEGKELLVDMAYYEEKQRIPNTETGEWADYRDLPQYRVLAFSVNGQKDIDTREQEYSAFKNAEAFKMDEAPTKEKIKEKVGGEF